MSRQKVFYSCFFGGFWNVRSFAAFGGGTGLSLTKKFADVDPSANADTVGGCHRLAVSSAAA